MDSTEIHDREFLLGRVEQDGDFNDGVGGFTDVEVANNVLTIRVRGRRDGRGYGASLAPRSDRLTCLIP